MKSILWPGNRKGDTIKIALVSDVIYPYVKGGAEKRTYEIAKSLRDRGHEIHLVGMKWWKGDTDFVRNNIHYHGVCKCRGLHNKNSTRSTREAIRYSLYLIRHFLENDYDIVDSNEFPYLSNFVVKRYCILKKKPMIITWHEVLDNHWYEYLDPYRGSIGRFIEKKTARLPDIIIANSRKTKNDLVQKLNITQEKIAVIQPTISADLSNIPHSQEKFDILFCGRLIKDKHVDMLVRAIKTIDPAPTCAIIGEGPEKKRLETLVKKYSLEKRIKFLGFLNPHKEVLSYMKSSKLFVSPSTREGFGIAVSEANACALPAIVIDGKNNAARHLIKDGVNGFVCENDEKMLSEKIALILGDNKLRSRLSRNCKKMSSAMSTSKSASKIEQIYKSLL